MRKKTFMKNAPKLLCGLADPWTACSDEEKVQLLSVLGLTSDSSSSTGSVSTQSTSPTLQHSLCSDGKLVHIDAVDDDLPCDPSSVQQSMNFSDSFMRNDAHHQAAPTNEGQHLEWIFTLYDFDRKGRVTKADIASLVRSIYEVLGTTKIALNTNKKTANDEAADDSGKQTSAFKIKLTVLAGDNCTVTSDPNSTVPVRQEIPIGTPKMGVKRRSLTFPSAGQQIPLTPVPHCLPNCSKRPRHQPNKENEHVHSPRKHNNNANNALMSQSWPAKTVSAKKVDRNSVAYRDYVNLSELEACCSAGLHQPYPGVHHIRHCDRHCSCAHQKNCQTVYCCKANGCHSSPTRSTNPNASKGNEANRVTDKQDGAASKPKDCCSPPSTHFFNGSCSSMHERKHRNRDKEHKRAMQLVQDWIVKEGKHTEPQTQPIVRKLVQHQHIHHHYIHTNP